MLIEIKTSYWIFQIFVDETEDDEDDDDDEGGDDDMPPKR
jgi:hypothetical protein